MLGNGDGTFRPRVNFSAGAQSQDLAAGDFNSDGQVDLAVSLNSSEFSLALLTGNGNGTFNAPIMFDNTAAQDDSPAIVATDLDNDGRLDVVLAHMLSCFVSPCVAARNITVMLGLGDGTFQTPFEMDIGTGMSRIAVGDFNSDGIKDLGIAGDQSQVYVLLGIGNGSFLKQPTINLLTAGTIGVDGTDIDVADLNGDTIQDLVVAIALNGSRTAVLLGNNDGTFQPARIITEPRLRVPQYQVIADFNRDGFLDWRSLWQTERKVCLRFCSGMAMAHSVRRCCTRCLRRCRVLVAERLSQATSIATAAGYRAPDRWSESCSGRVGELDWIGFGWSRLRQCYSHTVNGSWRKFD